MDANNVQSTNIVQYNVSVIVMGGDVTFSQCMNGLIQHNVTESGKNLDDKDLQISPLETRLGYLPGGRFCCF